MLPLWPHSVPVSAQNISKEISMEAATRLAMRLKLVCLLTVVVGQLDIVLAYCPMHIPFPAPDSEAADVDCCFRR